MTMKFAATLLSCAGLLLSNAAIAYEWQALPDKAPEPANTHTTQEKDVLVRMLYFDPRF